MSHLQSSADVPLLVVSDNSRSERRISPSWTIETLRTRLEPITGVPVSAQRLSLRGGSQQPINLDGDGSIQLHAFNVASFSELRVSSHSYLSLDARPQSQPATLQCSVWRLKYRRCIDDVIRSMIQDPPVSGRTTPMSLQWPSMKCRLKTMRTEQTVFWLGRRHRNWVALIRMHQV